MAEARHFRLFTRGTGPRLGPEVLSMMVHGVSQALVALLLVYSAVSLGSESYGPSWMGIGSVSTWSGDCKGDSWCRHKTRSDYSDRLPETRLSDAGLFGVHWWYRCSPPRPGDRVDLLVTAPALGVSSEPGRTLTRALVEDAEIVAHEVWKPAHRTRERSLGRTAWVKLPPNVASFLRRHDEEFSVTLALRSCSVEDEYERGASRRTAAHLHELRVRTNFYQWLQAVSESISTGGGATARIEEAVRELDFVYEVILDENVFE